MSTDTPAGPPDDGAEVRRLDLRELAGQLPWVLTVVAGSPAATSAAAGDVLLRARFGREADAREIEAVLIGDGGAAPISDDALDRAASWVETNVEDGHAYQLLSDPRPGMRYCAAEVLARCDPLGDRASVRATASDVLRYATVAVWPYEDDVRSQLEAALAHPSDETLGRYALTLAHAASMVGEPGIAMARRESVARLCSHRKIREEGALLAALNHERFAGATTGEESRRHLTTALELLETLPEGSAVRDGTAPGRWLGRARIHFKLGNDSQCKDLCLRAARVEGDTSRAYDALHMVRALRARAGGDTIIWAESAPLIGSEEQNTRWLETIPAPPDELIDPGRLGYRSCAGPAMALDREIAALVTVRGTATRPEDAATVTSMRQTSRALWAEALRRTDRYPMSPDSNGRNGGAERACLAVARHSWHLGDTATAYAAFGDLYPSNEPMVSSEAGFSREAIRWSRAGARAVMTSIGLRLASQAAEFGI